MFLEFSDVCQIILFHELKLDERQGVFNFIQDLWNNNVENSDSGSSSADSSSDSESIISDEVAESDSN